MKYDRQFKTWYTNVDDFIKDNYGGLPSEGELTKIYNELPDYEVDYDSKTDTLLHIKRVNTLLNEAAIELLKRAIIHDKSKLETPEKPFFDEFTPKLAGSTYGSDEYKSYLKDLKVGLDHHYTNNSHHPEHYPNGINGFDLFDLIEMFFDWKAATERHNNGNIYKSIEINKERFGISDQLCEIFKNTAEILKY